MIETEITILINRKSDIDLVKQQIIDNNIQFPVYIFELNSFFQIEFTSDYEEWEIDTKILSCFPDYEFTKELEKGRKEIRIQIARCQSELSTDGWGRQIENPLSETKYLIRKSTTQLEEYNPNVKVLFGSKEQNYFVNIVNGLNKSSNEKGFLLVNSFKSKNENTDAEIFKDRLYKTPNEAFRFGYYKMQQIVNEDYDKYNLEEKKKITEMHKVPRKIARNFINACNKFEIPEMLKSLDTNFIFEKRIKWQTEIRTEGIQQFEEYLKSTIQDLCLMDFKIRSSWSIKLPNVEVGVKYYPKRDEKFKSENNFLKYKRLIFELHDNKILSVIEEQ